MANVTINWGNKGSKEENKMKTNVEYTLPHKGFSIIEGIGSFLYDAVRGIGNLLDKPILQAGAEVYNKRLNTMGATPRVVYNTPGINDSNRRVAHKEVFVSGKLSEEIITLAGRAGMISVDKNGHIVKNYKGDMLDEASLRANAAYDLVDAKTGEAVKVWDPTPAAVQAVINGLKQKAAKINFNNEAAATASTTTNNDEVDNNAKVAEGEAEEATQPSSDSFVYADDRTYPVQFVVNGVTHDLRKPPYSGNQDLYVDAYIAFANVQQQPEQQQQQPASTVVDLKTAAGVVNGIATMGVAVADAVGADTVSAVLTGVAGAANVVSSVASEQASGTANDSSTTVNMPPALDAVLGQAANKHKQETSQIVTIELGGSEGQVGEDALGFSC